MTEIVSVFIQPFIDHADKRITDYFKNIKGVDDEVKKISSNLSCIKAMLEKLAGSQQYDPLLIDWLKKLESVAVDAQDVLDTYKTEVALGNIRKETSVLGKASIKSKLAEEIKDVSKTLEIIRKEREDFNISDRGGSPKRNQTSGKEHEFRESGSSSATCHDYFVGRKDMKGSLMSQMTSKSLVEGRIHIFPIIGISGLGKTTLAQQIYNDEDIELSFGEYRMWISITIDFDYEDFFSKLNLFLNRRNVSDFLLVLDDVQDIRADHWMQLEKLLKENCKKSILLFTTHNSDMATRILGEEPPPESYLPVLPDQDCVELFRRVAFPNGLPRNLREEYVWGIINKCKGLPLAVKAIAWVLKGNAKDESKWESILESDIWELEQGASTSETPNILPALRLGYSHLPCIIKQCFAFCSIFPKGYVFQKEELVKLWIAGGFTDPNNRQKYEKIGENYFDVLLARSFFQVVQSDDEKVRYRLHDLMHEVAQSVSSPHCCLVKDYKSCHFSNELLHVSLLCEDVEKLVEQIVKKSMKLRTLRLPSSSMKVEALEKLFKTLKYIRVLDLSSSSLEKLPRSVTKLKLLRYLDLSNTKIRVLPDSICNLYNLQTLKLLGCAWLLELPKDLGKLVNLRHLELDDIFWYHCTKLPPNMGKITNLHNLPVFPVSSTSGHGIEELDDMHHLTGELHISMLENAVNVAKCKLDMKESLEKVVLEWGEKIVNKQDEVAVMDKLRPHSNLKVLKIHHFKGSRFPSWLINGSLKNLVNLSLNNCTKCTTLSVGQLKCLTELYIRGMLELEEWPESDQCASLRYLKVSYCPKLKMLPCEMPDLRSLKIKGCHSLRALPMTPSLKLLTLIDNLVLEDWKELPAKYGVFQDDGQGRFTEGSGASIDKTLNLKSLVQLMELKIVNCPKIPALPMMIYPRKLEISGCELLTDLLDRYSAGDLHHLGLERCSNETILTKIQNTGSLCSMVLSSISNLRSLPQQLQLPGLKALYISDCEELTSLSEGGSLQTFSSLKLLSVRGCPNLESLQVDLPTELECLIIVSCHYLQSLGARDTLKRLPSLKDMYIEDCPLLVSFPEEGLPTSLQHLVIQGCPELTAKCQQEGAEWPKIENVPDLEIESMKPSSAQDIKSPSWLPRIWR